MSHSEDSNWTRLGTEKNYTEVEASTATEETLNLMLLNTLLY